MTGPINPLDQQGGIPTGSAFASFDPRIDGCSAVLGARWQANDCPIVLTKVGPGRFDWTIEGQGSQSALAACMTPAEVNALYQGLSRSTLDMTPEDILTPDVVNDRLTSYNGDHWTRQGIGVGASIGKSPLYDNLSQFGYQAIETGQTGGQNSYYQATSPTVFDIASEPYVVAWIPSFTASAGGAVVIGKINLPPGTRRGWWVSQNSGGGFGFETSGDLAILNQDIGGASVADGRLRIFHHGQSRIAAGFGFVRCAGFNDVLVGQPGDLSAADASIGICEQVGASTVATANQQVCKVVLWRGAAAENVIANLGPIEAALQSQLDSAQQLGITDALAINHPVRALGVPFVPDAARPVMGIYSVLIEATGAVAIVGNVELRADYSNPPTTVQSRIDYAQTYLTYGASGGVLVGEFLPGMFVEIVATGTVNPAGITFTLQAVTEVVQ